MFDINKAKRGGKVRLNQDGFKVISMSFHDNEVLMKDRDVNQSLVPCIAAVIEFPNGMRRLLRFNIDGRHIGKKVEMRIRRFGQFIHPRWQVMDLVGVNAPLESQIFHDSDLRLLTDVKIVRRTGWINLYRFSGNYNGEHKRGGVFETEEEAKGSAFKDGYVTTIEIKWDEPEA